jgi:hypothetical protein
MNTAVLDDSLDPSEPFDLRDRDTERNRDTEEAEWARLLADRPAWSPQTEQLVIVAPHPARILSHFERPYEAFLL